MKAVDYLIWLIDIENGVIKEEDIDFITNNIGSEKQVLVVINKAAKKPNDFVMDVIEKTRDVLLGTDINVINVLAYDSRDACEFDEEAFNTDRDGEVYIPMDQGKIALFLREINKNSIHKPDIIDNVRSICNDVSWQLNNQISACDRIAEQYLNIIKNNDDASNLSSILELYRTVTVQRNDLERLTNALNAAVKKIRFIEIDKENKL